MPFERRELDRCSGNTVAANEPGLENSPYSLITYFKLIYVLNTTNTAPQTYPGITSRSIDEGEKEEEMILNLWGDENVLLTVLFPNVFLPPFQHLNMPSWYHLQWREARERLFTGSICVFRWASNVRRRKAGLRCAASLVKMTAEKSALQAWCTDPWSWCELKLLNEMGSE